MLFIGEPYIAQNGDRSRLVCDIGINRRETRTVWFEVDREYEKYLCVKKRRLCNRTAQLGNARWTRHNLHGAG